MEVVLPHTLSVYTESALANNCSMSSTYRHLWCPLSSYVCVCVGGGGGGGGGTIIAK